jgi:hypothetical protein
MSGSGLVVNMDRRRTSLGIEEKALSTLEKFVELVERGGIDEEEDEGSAESVLDNLDNDSEKGSINGGERSYCSAPNTITGAQSKRSKADANRAKLCELFIDPSLLELKTKALTGSNNSIGSGDYNGSESKKPAKKSEEIWVKRVNDPARRSFRVVVSPHSSLLSRNTIKFDSYQCTENFH